MFSSEMSDGVKLLQLLEIIGDENLGKYYKAPKLRVQKVSILWRVLVMNFGSART